MKLNEISNPVSHKALMVFGLKHCKREKREIKEILTVNPLLDRHPRLERHPLIERHSKGVLKNRAAPHT